MNNININKNSNQSGRSMIEMLGVLAIVGVLSVGGIAGYSKAMEKFKINKTADQVSQIVTNIRTLYAQQTTYAGLNNVSAYNMGVLPDEMGTGTNLKNPFNGGIYISSGDVGPVTSNWGYDVTFDIIYDGLSKQACVTLATMDWGSTSSSGLLGLCISSNSGCRDMISLYVEMNSGGNGYGKHGVNHLPLSVANAATECNCPNNDCSLGWKFY